MKCDVIFKEMLKDILENGVSTNDRPTRPVYPDTGLPAHTIKKFGVVNRYNLKEEFPIPTLRPIPLKNCIDEILWIWQKKSNRVCDLRSHIWDSWAGHDGTIGKAYGYQVGAVQKVKTTLNNLLNSGTFFEREANNIINEYKNVEYDRITNFFLDQTDYILHELKYNPYSRRIIGNLYNIQDLDEMNLHPCCYSITLNVVGNTLNMILNQRSADLITAGNWNV